MRIELFPNHVDAVEAALENERLERRDDRSTLRRITGGLEAVDAACTTEHHERLDSCGMRALHGVFGPIDAAVCEAAIERAVGIREDVADDDVRHRRIV